MMTIRRIAALVLAMALIMSFAGALADDPAEYPAAKSETVAKLLEILDFKFFVREDGIGLGSQAVYTAPSTSSLRLADGKATCSVETEIAVAGHIEGGWLLIRYDIGKKDEKDRKARVGYIRNSKDYESKVSKITFGSIPAELTEDIEITDNPRSNSTPFGTLPAGTAITILAKYTYTGNWWYVETELDGKLTRGFIDRSTAAIKVDGEVYRGNEALGIPAKSPKGTVKTGTVTMNGTDEDALIVRKENSPKSGMVARAYGGDVYPCYAQADGAREKLWYYIWVDGVWGWVSSGISTYTADE